MPLREDLSAIDERYWRMVGWTGTALAAWKQELGAAYTRHGYPPPPALDPPDRLLAFVDDLLDLYSSKRLGKHPSTPTPGVGWLWERIRMLVRSWWRDHRAYPAQPAPAGSMAEAVAQMEVARNWLAAARAGRGAEATPASPPAAAEGAPAGASKRTSGKRGRPSDTDRKSDKRIYDAWNDNQYRSYAELAAELGKSQREVKTAIDRHRKRLERNGH